MADTPFEGLSNETLRNARDISDSMSDISSAASRLGRELEGVDGYTSGINTKFSQIRRSADKVADIQEEARKSAKGTAKALDEQAKNLSRVRQLNLAIDKLYAAANRETGETRDNLLRQAQNLSNARDNAKDLAGYYGKIADDAARLDKGSSAFDTMGQIASKYFGSNFAKPFQAASDAARQQALDNAKLGSANLKTGKGLNKQALERLGILESMTLENGKVLTGTSAAAKIRKEGLLKGLKSQSTLSAGFKAMGPILSKALGPLMWVKLVADSIKFIVSLFIDANKQAVDLARAMGTSVETADAMRARFRDVRTLTGQTRNNIVNLIQATKELTSEFGNVGYLSNDLLNSQTFLTKRVGSTAQEASKLNLLFASTGVNAEKGTAAMNQMVINLAEAEGVAIPLRDVISDITNAGSEIAGYFGFSTDELTQAVFTTRKLGLSLSQAKSVAEGLLNFESSIGAELEAELMTGKNLYFNRARVLAATGDIAGATKEVLVQMQNLTEEQRRSPIIMKSAAAAAGLSVEELNKAYLLSRNINAQRNEYRRIRIEEGRERAQEFLKEYGIKQAEVAQIERRMTINEQFQEAMVDVRQQFVGLVKGGTIQILVDAIKALANFVDGFTGPSQGEKLNRDIIRATTQGKITEQQAKNYTAQAQKIKEEEQRLNDTFRKMNSGMGASAGAAGAAMLYESMARKKQKALRNEINANDFTIRTHPKDTLVMAGGTKLGEDNKKTNQLLERLVAAVERGGNVYIDGNAAGKSMVLGTYTSS